MGKFVFLCMIIILSSLPVYGQTKENSNNMQTKGEGPKTEIDIAKKWSDQLCQLSFVRSLDTTEIKKSTIDLSSILDYNTSGDNEYVSNLIGALGQNYQRVDMLLLSSKHMGQQSYAVQILFKHEEKVDTLSGEMKLNACFETQANVHRLFIYSFRYKFSTIDTAVCLEGVNSISFYLENEVPKNYWYEDGSFNEYVRTFVGTYSGCNTGEKMNCVFAVRPAGLYNCLPFCEELYTVKTNDHPDFYYINDKYQQFGWKEYDYRNPKSDKWWK